MASDTRAKLLDAAMRTIAEHGIAGASARQIAACAGVNQALVFYHFGSVDRLLTAAGEHSAQQRVARYRERFAQVHTIAGLLELGRAIHAEERAEGNVAVLAQLLAAAQADSRLAPVTSAGLGMWVAELERVLPRLLAPSSLPEFVDTRGLARAIAAAFVGLELYEGVDPEGAESALAALEQLAAVLAVLSELGPLAQRGIRTHLTRQLGRSD